MKVISSRVPLASEGTVKVAVSANCPLRVVLIAWVMVAEGRELGTSTRSKMSVWRTPLEKLFSTIMKMKDLKCCMFFEEMYDPSMLTRIFVASNVNPLGI